MNFYLIGNLSLMKFQVWLVSDKLWVVNLNSDSQENCFISVLWAKVS